jgi:hypothetical protein
MKAESLAVFDDVHFPIFEYEQLLFPRLLKEQLVFLVYFFYEPVRNLVLHFARPVHNHKYALLDHFDVGLKLYFYFREGVL